MAVLFGSGANRTLTLTTVTQPQEAPGGPRRPQKAPRAPRKPQEAPGGPRRPQEGPRQPPKAPGGPRRPHQEATRGHMQPQEPPERPRRLQKAFRRFKGAQAASAICEGRPDPSPRAPLSLLRFERRYERTAPPPGQSASSAPARMKMRTPMLKLHFHAQFAVLS